MMSVKIIVVSGPSGVGKSSFVDRLCAEDDRFVDIPTFTTRSPRAGESQGRPYFFVDRKEFERKITEGFFVEWQQVHGNLYGTPRSFIEEAWRKGKTVIIDLDVKGAQAFREQMSDGLKTLFILPPNLEELRRRILARDPARPPQDLTLRLDNARYEIEQASRFDAQIVNDQLEGSYQEFKKIIDSWISPK
ncbi:MAG: guanylate kinase [Bdellovibrionaceae bacterium]|nr:guanylate kinase [Pseudobdellovibrionaceae bacterium]MDW8191026.1 guanylate kinase [Pseudobdellovibrionaceae bacterium]